MSEMTFKIVMTIVLGGLIVALGMSLLSGVHPKVVTLSFGAVAVLGYYLYQVWSDFQ